VKTRNPWWEIKGSGAIHEGVKGGSYYYSEERFVPNSFGSYGYSNSDLNTSGSSSSQLLQPCFIEPTVGEGTSAWRRFKPRTINADVSRFIGELKDLPQMLRQTSELLKDRYLSLGGKRKSRLMSPKSVADQFLNYNFGWVPFLSDIIKFFEQYSKTNDRMRRLRHYNGEWHRRRGMYPEVSVKDSYVAAGNAPLIWPSPLTYTLRYPYQGYPNKWGETLFTQEIVTKTWFEGAFRYWIPSLEEKDTISNISNFMRQYGLMISPKLVWDLTPWSWLIDWWTNLGDIYDNLQSLALDNLVAKYAYIMRTKDIVLANESTIHYKDGSSPTYKWYQWINGKARKAASPFGFETSDLLSAKQNALLVALGLSRLPFR